MFDILRKGLLKRTLIRNGGEDPLGKNIWKGFCGTRSVKDWIETLDTLGKKLWKVKW